jgi:hypothetical protein
LDSGLKSLKLEVKIMDYKETKSKEVIEKTIEALKANGINALVVDSGEEAKKKVLEMIPEGSDVMTMTSVTADSIGLSQELNESGKYNGVKAKLYSPELSQNEKNAIGAATQYTVGSVHAVTQDGKVVIASGTGSQLPAYAYSSSNVIWVVGTQKVVENLDEAMKRLYDHVLPLESERARKAYGVPGSNVSKLLVINKEVNPTRLTLIFVNEALGF